MSGTHHCEGLGGPNLLQALLQPLDLFLTGHQCKILQGFLLARPMPLDGVIDLLDHDFSSMLTATTG